MQRVYTPLCSAWDYYPVILNIWKRGRDFINSNGVIFGKPGSGKSYFAKLLIEMIYSGSSRIFILDPEGINPALEGFKFRPPRNSRLDEPVNLSAEQVRHSEPVRSKSSAYFFPESFVVLFSIVETWAISRRRRSCLTRICSSLKISLKLH